MKGESYAQIFKSDQRTIEETSIHKCFNTYNFKRVVEGDNKSIGQLIFFNDVFLSPLERMTYTLEKETCVVVLPIAGSLNYYDKTQKEELVKSEQSLFIKTNREISYTLYNPFKKGWVNFLHIGFHVNFFSFEKLFTLQQIPLKKMDELVSIGLPVQDEVSGCIGMYHGRSKGTYRLTKQNATVFVFVIAGAFEVQGRLMEHRDGLSLWNVSAIEFEALSNNAIILLLEIKSNNY